MKRNFIFFILVLFLFSGCIGELLGYYDVIFDNNGGKGIMLPERKNEKGDVFTLPESTFEAPEGKEFKEWNTEADGSGDSYAVGDSITFEDSDIKFYAIWKDLTYKASFDKNGGIGSIPFINGKKYGDSMNLPVCIFTPPNLKEFKEWNTVADGSGDSFGVGESYTFEASDVTFYAIWKDIPSEFNITTDDIMKYVAIPASGITFPRGASDNSTGTVASDYYIAETETTYRLWNAVRTWAVDNQAYVFVNEGRQGGEYHNENTPVGDENHPVTRISWKDAVVWCNALTEYYNSNNESEVDLVLVYYSDESFETILKSASDISDGTDVNVNPTATGFRLPSSEEWECAARWQGITAGVNYVETNPDGCTVGYYWTKGDSASGAISNSEDDSTTVAVGYVEPWTSMQVKSKVANALGLYDMSGNVREYLITLDGSRAMAVGGSFYDYANTCDVSETYSYDLDNIYDNRLSYGTYKVTTMGFRVVKNR